MRKPNAFLIATAPHSARPSSATSEAFAEQTDDSIAKYYRTLPYCAEPYGRMAKKPSMAGREAARGFDFAQFVRIYWNQCAPEIFLSSVRRR